MIKRAKPDRNRSTSRDRSCRRRNTVSLGRDFSRKSPRNRDHLKDPARRRSATEFPLVAEKGAKNGTNDEAIQTDPPDESVIYGTGRVIDLDSNKKSLSTTWSDTLPPKIIDAKEATSANGEKVQIDSSKLCKSTATGTSERGTNFNAPSSLNSHSSSSLRPSPTPVRSLLDQLSTSRSIFMNNSSHGPGKQQVVFPSSSPSSPPTSRHTHPRCLRQESSSPSDDEHILTDDHRNNTPVMVKMRQQATTRLSNDRSRSKLCHEDGRSSSGNWSASSSQSNPDSDTGLGSNANCAGGAPSSCFRKKTNHNNNCNRSKNSHNNNNCINITAGLPASVLNEVNCLTDSGYQFSRSPSDHSVDDKESFISDSLIAHPTDSEQNTNGYTSDTSALSGLSLVKSPCEEAKESISGCSRSSSSDHVLRRCSKDPRSSKKSQVQYANRDSESWLQYFEGDGSSDATVTPTVESNQNLSDTDTIKGTNSTTTNLSRRSSVNDRSTVTGGEEGNSQCGLDETLGEEAESVHSMDTDGYYTSMHTDSGLMRGGKPVQLLMTPYSSFRSKNSKRCSIASTGTIGDISLNSVLSNSDMESSVNEISPALHPPPPQPQSHSHNLNNECTQRMNRLSFRRGGCGGRKEPPLPPPRTTPSRRDSSSSSSHSPGHGVAGSHSRLHVKTQLDLRDSHSPSPHATASASESETSECQMRRRQKTTIDSSKYPSLCVVTTSEGSDLNSSDDEGGFDERDEHHFIDEGEWDLTTNRGRVERTHKGFKIKDIFSMKPLDALSKTISKSRESIEDKIRRSFGGHGSSSPSFSNASPKKIPPPTKCKPKVKFHQTLLVPPQTSSPSSSSPSSSTSLNQFFKRTSERVKPEGAFIDNNGPINDQDPFSRLFPLRPTICASNDVRSPLPPPLKVDHSSLLRRPASLNLSSSEDHGPGRTAFTFLSSLKEEENTSCQRENGQRKLSAMKKEKTPETIVESEEEESDYSQRDYLQEILSLSSSPKKISTVDPVYLKTCYGMSQSAPVTPQIATLAERKAELFKNIEPVGSPVSKVNTSSSFCPNVASSPISSSPASGPALSPLSPSSTGRKCLLTTEELLHLIYSTKKAANVKTDVECSLAAGGRLMPRSVTPNPGHGLMCDGLPGQRRSSWAGGPPLSKATTEYLSLSPRRSSIAAAAESPSSDAFQPSKPTTMNDFIRLISAKSSQISNAASPSVPRKSAAELLQVNSPSSLATSSTASVSSMAASPSLECATSNCNSNQLPASPVSPNNLSINSNSSSSPSQTSCSPPHAAKTRVINGRIYRAPYRLETMYPTIEELTEEHSLNKSSEKLDNQPSPSQGEDSNKNSLILLPSSHISDEHLSNSCINKNSLPSNTSSSSHNNENNNNSNINNNNSLCHEKDGHTLHTESEVNIVSDIKNIKAPLADEESLDSLENQVEFVDSHHQTQGITVNQERNGTSTWV